MNQRHTAQRNAVELRRTIERRSRRLARKRIGNTPTIESLEPRLLMSASLLSDKSDIGTQIDLDSAAIQADWFGDFGGTGIASGSGGGSAFDFAPRWMIQFDMSKFSVSASLSEVTETFDLSGVNGRVVRGLGLQGIALVETDGTLGVDETLAYFADSGFVLSVEADQLLSVDQLPNDSRFSSLYGLNNVGQTGGTADADIDATEAWNLSVGSSDIVIGVIDTGVDYLHSDLAANMWVNTGEIAGNGIDDDNNGFVDDIHGFDFANDDGDPMDDNNHGTHVAGTIAGVGNNGTGVTGVSWNSKIMALKFMDDSGRGYTSDAVRAINYAAMMKNRGVNVVATNNSWGGGGSSSSVYNAIAANRDAGILFIAAAGNEGHDNDAQGHYPSNYDLSNVISVAATDSRDNLASFSNFGQVSVDLAAPGVGILSTITGNRYASFSGTSMATPHVAGVVALAFSFAPSATMTQVKDALLQGVDSITGLEGDVATAGRLNANNTLQILANSVGTDPAPAPEPEPEPTPVQGDVYEDNDEWFVARDRAEGATNSPNFGLVTSAFTINNLDTLDDANDWYRLEFANTDDASIQINFAHSQGDLDMVIYRADTGAMVDLSNGTGNSESVSLDGEEPGVFYLHVFGYQDAASPEYSMTVNVSPPPAAIPALPYDVGFNEGQLVIDGGNAADHVRLTSAGNGNVRIESGSVSHVFENVTSITIHGGGGNDLIEIANDLTNAQGQAIRASVYGGDGDDTIHTGDGDDMIMGGAGNDTIFANGGNDQIYGEAGDDEIHAGDGDNIIVSDGRDDDGNDRVFAGKGNDHITTGSGNDEIDAGDGNNAIASGHGDDDVTAGNGDDRIIDTAGSNIIRAGDGDNVITSRKTIGDDNITTGSGNDRITVTGGNNTINAGDGNNIVTMRSRTGNDTITTGSGDDRITDAGGNNIIHAGDGTNTIITRSATGNDRITTGSGRDYISDGGGTNRINAGLGENHIRTKGNNTVIATNSEVPSIDSLIQPAEAPLENNDVEPQTEAAAAPAQANASIDVINENLSLLLAQAAAAASSAAQAAAQSFTRPAARPASAFASLPAIGGTSLNGSNDAEDFEFDLVFD